MKTLRSILKAMNFSGQISLRRRIYRDIIYVGGGNADLVINRYGGYKVESMIVVDNVLVIYVN